MSMSGIFHYPVCHKCGQRITPSFDNVCRECGGKSLRMRTRETDNQQTIGKDDITFAAYIVIIIAVCILMVGAIVLVNLY